MMWRDDSDLHERLARRWPGFSSRTVRQLRNEMSGLTPDEIAAKLPGLDQAYRDGRQAEPEVESAGEGSLWTRVTDAAADAGRFVSEGLLASADAESLARRQSAQTIEEATVAATRHSHNLGSIVTEALLLNPPPWDGGRDGRWTLAQANWYWRNGGPNPPPVDVDAQHLHRDPRGLVHDG